MNENENENYDDDYSTELHLDRKSREGWSECAECGDRLHYEDACEGIRCSCDDE